MVHVGAAQAPKPSRAGQHPHYGEHRRSSRTLCIGCRTALPANRHPFAPCASRFGRTGLLFLFAKAFHHGGHIGSGIGQKPFDDGVRGSIQFGTQSGVGVTDDHAVFCQGF